MAVADYVNTSVFADDPVPTHVVGTLLDQNADIPAWCVLGRITASGKWTISTAAANDGSQVPRGINAYPVPDPGADAQIAIYDQGSFVAEKLTFGAGHSAATVEAALRANSINIRLKSAGAVKPA